MNTKIKQLDQQAINQIAAGEVVDRPLSVVKELIENALDASAQKIEITIEGGGTSFIRIKDDGFGMASDDLHLAILPHATSKITTIGDLESLLTLGFRGEALPSIASVSKLSIMSKTPHDIAGYEIQIEGGNLISTTETGCPTGTIVTVKDLFFNTPARRKFLRSAATEFSYISDMVSRLAMARPDVSFTLRHPQSLILNTSGKGDLLETIAAIYGNDMARSLLPISPSDGDFQITGFLSPPDLVRSANTAITFLLNGRVIRSKLLNQALKEGYHTLIPVTTYPIAVISLKMNPSAYDVNVHPAKTEVKFKAEKKLFEAISSIVRDTLMAAKPVRSLFLAKDKQQKDRQQTMAIQNKTWQQQKILYRPLPDMPYKDLQTKGKIFAEEESSSSTKPALQIAEKYISSEPVSDKPIFNKPFQIEQIPTDSHAQVLPEKDEKSVLSFPELRPIGQLFMTYLLCTDGKSLYIIDQHAAHERIRYEELCLAFQQNTLSSQLLLLPETVELTIQEEQILLQNLAILQEIGFVIEHFGGRTYFLRGIPVLEHLNHPGEIFQLFLGEMMTKAIPPKRDQLFEEWIFMIACRTAVKGHDALTISEMEKLIQRLGHTKNPFSCPHGRPTVVEVPKKELENRFNR